MLAKAILATAISFSAAAGIARAENLTLKASPAGKDATLFGREDSRTRNFGDSPSFQAATWTWNADTLGTGTYRGLIAFDLSALPAGAYVHSARLHLFCDTSTFSQGHSSLSKSNAAHLARVIDTWAESTVTWNNRPRVDAYGRVNIAQSKTALDNYILDVTTMVARMAAKPDSNFGMMLYTQTESPYNALTFASGDHADSTLRPVLEITWFKTKLETLDQRPGAAGKDAAVWSREDAKEKNFGDGPRFNTETWTWDNDNLGRGTTRSLIEFDLKSLPAKAKVEEARLHLFCDVSNFNKGHSSLSQSNAAWLSRVTEAWAESTVTWNNQPKVQAAGRVALAQSKSLVQNYEVDVTALVADLAKEPAANYGFQLASQIESPYHALNFASGDHPDSSLHPRLVVHYSLGDVDPVSVDWTPVRDFASAHRLAGRVLAFERPMAGVLTDLRGAVVLRFAATNRLDLAGLRPGAYAVRLPGAAFRIALP